MRSTSSASRFAGSALAASPSAIASPFTPSVESAGSEGIQEPHDGVVDAHEGRLREKDEDATAELPLLELEFHVDDERLLPVADVLEHEGVGVWAPTQARRRREAHDLRQWLDDSVDARTDDDIGEVQEHFLLLLLTGCRRVAHQVSEMLRLGAREEHEALAPDAP